MYTTYNKKYFVLLLPKHILLYINPEHFNQETHYKYLGKKKIKKNNTPSYMSGNERFFF